MTRGEVRTVSGTGYAGKSRPAVIVQDDRFDVTESITICVFTTNDADAPMFRIPITPSPENGLRNVSRLMVDKLTTVNKSRLGERVGHLDNAEMARLDQAILIFLGLA